MAAWMVVEEGKFCFSKKIDMGRQIIPTVQGDYSHHPQGIFIYIYIYIAYCSHVHEDFCIFSSVMIVQNQN